MKGRCAPCWSPASSTRSQVRRLRVVLWLVKVLPSTPACVCHTSICVVWMGWKPPQLQRQDLMGQRQSRFLPGTGQRWTCDIAAIRETLGNFVRWLRKENLSAPATLHGSQELRTPGSPEWPSHALEAEAGTHRTTKARAFQRNQATTLSSR